jgi:hypothetical protein
MQPNVLLFLWVGFGYCTFYSALSAICYALFWSVNRMTSKFPISAETKSTVYWVINSLSIPVAIFIVYSQCVTWFHRMDHSKAYHFNNYASAVLDALPPNAILLVNYDQQWTSVRYKQQCEGFRTDVTSINLSMMTYQWFETKRTLYPHITFPGAFHTYPGSAFLQTHHAFTLLQFLNSNSHKHPVFLGGKYSYSDPALDSNYDSIPVGLVTQFLPYSASPNGTEYAQVNERSWRTVLQHLPALPDVQQFPEETWEWTIGRDFKDRVIGEKVHIN